jgi:hypothetical protein
MTVFQRLRRRLKSAGAKRWVAAAALWGMGLLPCPCCGTPMIMHFWPAALALTLLNLRRGKISACDTVHCDPADHETSDSGPE